MKRFALTAMVLAISLMAWAAGPDDKKEILPKNSRFELGLNLGEPTGISAKLWLDKTNAIEGIAAWAFSQGAFSASVDYLYNFHDLIKIGKEAFPFFVGIGAIARVGTGLFSMGLRVPVGVLYAFRDVPLEISLDFVPGMNLIPDTGFLPMGGIAVRYCF